MGIFILIYIIIGLLLLIFANYKYPFTKYLKDRGRGNIGLLEFIISCLVLLVMFTSAWPLLVFMGVKDLVKGEK